MDEIFRCTDEMVREHWKKFQTLPEEERNLILECVKKERIVDDIRGRYWFKDTPSVRRVCLAIARLAFPDAKEVTRVVAQSVYDTGEDGGIIVDVDVTLDSNEVVFLEIQRFHGSFDDSVSFSRWLERVATATIASTAKGGKRGAVIVLFDIEGHEANNRLKAFSRVRYVVYRNERNVIWSDGVEEEELDEELFPSRETSVIIIVNMSQVSKDDNEIGNILHDFYASSWKDMKNEDVKMRTRAMEESEEDIMYVSQAMKIYGAYIEEKKDKEFARIKEERDREFARIKEERDREFARINEERDREFARINEERDKLLEEKEKEIERLKALIVSK